MRTRCIHSPLALPAVCLALPLRAQTIPFSELGAKATADYQKAKGDAISIAATAEGARLHTAFQKLSGTASLANLAITTHGANAGDFTVSALSGTSVPVGGNTQIFLRLTVSEP